MKKNVFLSLLVAMAVAIVSEAQAQPKKPFRVGVVHEGGAFSQMVDGLNQGLRELGLEPGKDVLLDIRVSEGDRTAAEASARNLEQAKVDLLYVLGTSVAIAVKRATSKAPIAFVVGGDPVAAGLVASLARPGGRLTGVRYLAYELTAKRLEILKECLPRLQKIVTFYDPSNSYAVSGLELTRDAARQLGIEIVERPVKSIAGLRESFRALKPKEADAFFYIPDAMVVSQLQFIIDTARAKKLPTMLAQPGLVTQGALIGYGVNYYDVGRLSAKYVQRILMGSSPEDLPVESFSTYGLGVNLNTAREIGITIPQSVLIRADKIVE